MEVVLLKRKLKDTGEKYLLKKEKELRGGNGKMNQQKRQKKKDKYKNKKENPYKKGGKYRTTKKESILLLMLTCLMFLMVGGTLNHLAVTKNDCRMPINSNSHYKSETHISFPELNYNVNHKYITDYFGFETSKYNIYFSIGDVLMVFSFLIFIFLSIKYYKTRK